MIGSFRNHLRDSKPYEVDEPYANPSIRAKPARGYFRCRFPAWHFPKAVTAGRKSPCGPDRGLWNRRCSELGPADPGVRLLLVREGHGRLEAGGRAYRVDSALFCVRAGNPVRTRPFPADHPRLSPSCPRGVTTPAKASPAASLGRQGRTARGRRIWRTPEAACPRKKDGVGTVRLPSSPFSRAMCQWPVPTSNASRPEMALRKTPGFAQNQL